MIEEKALPEPGPHLNVFNEWVEPNAKQPKPDLGKQSVDPYKKESQPGFCETPNSTCTLNYCDDNGCNDRKRNNVHINEHGETVYTKEQADALERAYLKNDPQEVENRFNPHNSTLIEELKEEFRNTTQCDSSWHSGVNDGMYKLLQYLVANDLIIKGKKPKNHDKQHFDKMLLKELAWKLDREVWAHVPNPEPSEEWSTSKARERTRELIAEYIGDYDALITRKP